MALPGERLMRISIAFMRLPSLPTEYPTRTAKQEVHSRIGLPPDARREEDGRSTLAGAAPGDMRGNRLRPVLGKPCAAAATRQS
jgi:hypothetical protein